MFIKIISQRQSKIHCFKHFQVFHIKLSANNRSALSPCAGTLVSYFVHVTGSLFWCRPFLRGKYSNIARPTSFRYVTILFAGFFSEKAAHVVTAKLLVRIPYQYFFLVEYQRTYVQRPVDFHGHGSPEIQKSRQTAF